VSTADNPAPRRRVVLTLNVGADEMDAVPHALRQIAWDIERGSRGPCVSGSPSVGWNYVIDEDTSITHESYFRAIDVHLGKTRVTP